MQIPQPCVPDPVSDGRGPENSPEQATPSAAESSDTPKGREKARSVSSTILESVILAAALSRGTRPRRDSRRSQSHWIHSVKALFAHFDWPHFATPFLHARSSFGVSQHRSFVAWTRDYLRLAKCTRAIDPTRYEKNSAITTHEARRPKLRVRPDWYRPRTKIEGSFGFQ